MSQVAGDETNSQSRDSITKTVPITGGEFFVFFAGVPSQLPSDNAVKELKTAAWRFRDEAHRDPQSFAEGAALGGMIGNAAWAAAARGYVALRAHWQRQDEAAGPLDAAAVVKLVKRTCLEVWDKLPDRLDQATLDQKPDGSWRVSFSHGSAMVTVDVDGSGRLVHWLESDEK